MTVPLPGLSEALKANHIPVEPYIRLPGIQVSPHGLAYIPLPEPCSDFCLTNYLASTSGVESDAEDMNRILTIPHVSEVLAIFVTGGSMSVEIAKTTVTKALEAQKGWCMPIIRLIDEVRSTETPRLVGRAALSRNTHRSLGIAKAQQRMKEDEGKSDREVNWNMGCWLDPGYAKRGIMTAAYQYIFTQFYVPYLRTYPGQLTAGYLASNVASAKLQQRLGFKIVAKSYWVYEVRLQKGLPVGDDREQWKSGASIWQGFDGEYPVRKEESTLRDLEDWDE